MTILKEKRKWWGLLLATGSILTILTILIFFRTDREATDLITVDKYFQKNRHALYNYAGQPLAGIDPDTFEPIEGRYYRDKNSVYNLNTQYADHEMQLNILPDSDSSTFQIIKHLYAKDKNQVYFYDRPILGSDPNTFTLIDSRYTKDKNSVYFNGLVLQGANAGAFHLIDDLYAKDRDSVYYLDQLLKDADAISFLALKDRYAHDKYGAYHQGAKILGVDPSFEYLNDSYAKDENHVYWDKEIIDDADSKTFEYVDCGYAKDKNSVYYYNFDHASMDLKKNKFADSDPKTFKIIIDDDYCIGKDTNSVYWYGEKVENSNGSTFEILGNFYARDKKQAYYYACLNIECYDPKMSIIEEAEAETFEIINNIQLNDGDCTWNDPFGPSTFNSYARDRKFEYFQGKRIEHSHGPSFEVLDLRYSRDKHFGFYLEKKIIDSHGPTFKILGSDYAIDKNHVYYMGERMIGADINTFRTSESGQSCYGINRNDPAFSDKDDGEPFSQDKNHKYQGSKIINR